MPQFKPLLSIHGEPAVCVIAKRLRTMCPLVLVVTGYRSDDVRDVLADLHDEHVQCIENPDWERGMFSSLQAGARAINNDASFLVHMVDQPHIPTGVYEALFRAWRETRHSLYIPCYGDRRGHPVLCRSVVRTSILRRPPGDTTRNALAEFAKDAFLVPVPTAAVVHTINTPGDLEYITRVFLNNNG